MKHTNNDTKLETLDDLHLYEARWGMKSAEKDSPAYDGSLAPTNPKMNPVQTYIDAGCLMSCGGEL